VQMPDRHPLPARPHQGAVDLQRVGLPRDSTGLLLFLFHGNNLSSPAECVNADFEKPEIVGHAVGRDPRLKSTLSA